MLPAADIAEILTNLSALNLQPTATAQILAAVLAPLLRSSGDPGPLSAGPDLPRQRAGTPRGRRCGQGEPRSGSNRRPHLQASPPTARASAPHARSQLTRASH